MHDNINYVRFEGVVIRSIIKSQSGTTICTLKVKGVVGGRWIWVGGTGTWPVQIWPFRGKKWHTVFERPQILCWKAACERCAIFLTIFASSTPRVPFTNVNTLVRKRLTNYFNQRFAGWALTDLCIVSLKHTQQQQKWPHYILQCSLAI